MNAQDRIAAMTKLSDARLQELMREHKERAIHFEQSSDGGRFAETLAASVPHWEMHDICRELVEARAALKPLADIPYEVFLHK